MEMLATANAGGEKEDTGGREGEGAELLYYVHNPRKIVGEYTVQQPLLPSINIVSTHIRIPHTHTLSLPLSYTGQMEWE